MRPRFRVDGARHPAHRQRRRRPEAGHDATPGGRSWRDQPCRRPADLPGGRSARRGRSNRGRGRRQRPMSVEAKICGLSTPETVDAAVRFGARWVGFVTYPRSPRHVASNDVLKALGARVPQSVGRVGLFVDPDDALLDERLSTGAIDVLELQGAETPERIAAIKLRTGKPALKPLNLADALAVSRSNPPYPHFANPLISAAT